MKQQTEAVRGEGRVDRRGFGWRQALFVAVAALVLASGADARAPIRVGINTQRIDSFSDPLFQRIGWKRVRYIVRYDVAFRRRDRTYLDAYLAAAARHRLEPFIAFERKPGWRCPNRPCRLPSVRAYRKAIRAFRKRWPQVRVFAAWNEANHFSQPTANNPRRAAQYFNVLRRACRRCKIVAADVLDSAYAWRWLRAFKPYAHRPRIWGLHNYRDSNLRKGQRAGATRQFLRSTRRGEVWLTEAGGIVYFRTDRGKVLFRRSERRARRALRRMFWLARRYRRRIRRVYVYDWQQSSHPNRFDSGLLRRDGAPRPGYMTVGRMLAGRWFDP